VRAFFPIVAQAPFFGARVLPHPVKATFSFSIFVILLPGLLNVTTQPVGFDYMLILLMLKEFFIGVLLGYMLSMPFLIVQSAGIFVDHQRGGASLMVNDPTIQNQSSPLGTIFNYILIVLFFAINGPTTVIDMVMTSYEIIPPDKFFSSEFFVTNSPFWTMQMQLYNKFMILCIQLATPALLMILMTDVFLGIANRLAPQVQITFLGMPLKSLLGLLVIWWGFSNFNTEIVKQTREWLHTINTLITLFKPAA